MKLILSVTAALLLSAPAFAQGRGGEGNNVNCNGVGNPNSPCVPGTGGGGGTANPNAGGGRPRVIVGVGGAGGAGGAGGQGGAGGAGGNATATGGAGGAGGTSRAFSNQSLVNNVAVGAATGGPVGAVYGAAASGWGNPEFILGGTTGGSPPSTFNGCGDGWQVTIGPVGGGQTGESPRCVALREALASENITPNKPFAYERMCQGSAEWAKVDKLTYAACSANRTAAQPVVASVAPANAMPPNCRLVPGTNSITCD